MNSSSQLSDNVSTPQDSVPKDQDEDKKKSKIDNDNNLAECVVKTHTVNVMCTNKVSEGVSHWLNIDKNVDSERAISKARIVDPKSFKKEGWLADGISHRNSFDAEHKKLIDTSQIEDIQKIKTCKKVKDGVSLWQNYDDQSDLERAKEKARLVDPKKIKIDTRVSDGISQWKTFATNHQYKQTLNPFFDWDGAEIEARRINPAYPEEDYGWPVEGSLTWMRGQKAGKHIAAEIIELCKIIADRGDKQEDGTYKITFGKLFKTYVYISDKVVGMLWRARRHKLLDFPREMLYQGQDDDVLITLFRVPDEGEKLELKYWKKNDNNNNNQ